LRDARARVGEPFRNAEHFRVASGTVSAVQVLYGSLPARR
jgi:hypothetical protein